MSNRPNTTTNGPSIQAKPRNTNTQEISATSIDTFEHESHSLLKSDHSSQLHPLAKPDHRRSSTLADRFASFFSETSKTSLGKTTAELNESGRQSRSDSRKRSTTSYLERKRASSNSQGLSTIQSSKRNSAGTNGTIADGERRKWSSNASGQVVTTTHVMQNMSIFKHDSSGDLPETLTIVTEDIKEDHEDETIDIPPMPEARHVKSFSVAGEVVYCSDATTTRTRLKTDTDIVKSRKVEVAGMPHTHKREKSLVTFISTTGGMPIKKKICCPINFPKRWLSLRNVVAFFNVIILTFSILVISLVSYYAGVSSTRNAVKAMSNITISDIAVKMDEILGNAENFNLFSESIFSKPQYPITFTSGAIDHLYFLMTNKNAEFDQLYVVAPDSTFNGVGSLRINEQVIPKYVVVKYLNSQTRPNRLTFLVRDNCTVFDKSCVRTAFDRLTLPIKKSPYNVTFRPFYQRALETQISGWSDVYRYADSTLLGITAVRPVRLSNQLRFVAAVDITLDLLSEYLTSISNSMSSKSGDPVVLFVLEQKTANIIATSSLEKFRSSNGTRERLSALDDSIPEIQEPLTNLVSSMGPLQFLTFPENGDPIYFETSTGQIVLKNYQRSDGDILWIIGAFIPFSSFNQLLQNTFSFRLPLVALLVLSISVVCSVLVTRVIGKPLKRLAKQMLRIADLDFSVVENKQVSDDFCFDMELKEVQYLKSAMHSMQTGLKSFSKYVPLDVVTLLVKMRREAVLGVDEMEVSVFFSDIVNFTTIAEQLTPKQLVDLMKYFSHLILMAHLREYLSEMSAVILSTYGVVDKYIGDAIMAFWNAPISVIDHASIACQVALRCQTKLEELRKAWCSRGYPDIYARIGINTGLALVGNLGSESRLSYTCLGDTVNLASRLESLNKKYKTLIMISEFTHQKIGKELFVTRPIDLVTVKGKTRPVKVFELIGFRKQIPHEHQLAFTMYERAFHEYTLGNFEAAIDGFHAFLKLYREDDFVAMMHLETCQKYLLNKPSMWSPVVHLEDK